MTSSPFSEFIKYTKPGPQHPCPTCETYGLRRYAEPGGEERVICINTSCPASPLHRDGS